MMASLYQRKGRPGWYIDFKVPGSTRPTTKKAGAAKAEALRVKAEIERDIEGIQSQPGAPLTVGQAAEAWIQGRIDDPSKRNIASERMHVRLYIEPQLGAMPLTAVTRDEVKRFVRGLTSDGKGPKYVQNLHGTLRAILGWVCDEHPGAIPGNENPAAGAKAYLPKVSGAAKRKRRQEQTFDRAELATLFTAPEIDEEWRVLFKLAFYTACRSAEAVELRWRDYNPRRAPLGEIVVERTYGSGTNKTDTPRPTPVHPDLAETLERWRVGGFVEMMKRTPRPDDPIVPHPEGYARRPGWYYRRLQMSLDALGIRRRGTHAMRRALQSIALAGGANRQCMKSILHTSDDDISDVYVAFEWADLCAAIECARIYPNADSLNGELNEGANGVETCGNSGGAEGDRTLDRPDRYSITPVNPGESEQSNGDRRGQSGPSVSLTLNGSLNEDERARWAWALAQADVICGRFRARGVAS